ncbi:hypothetical protein Tco_0817817 [Tanacetum coccineum]
MITTTNRIKDKKPSRLMLLPMGILETFPCVKDVDYITRDLAVSSVRKNIMQISAQKQIIGPQESILRDELAFVHFRISTLETTLEDIQVHQNLLQSENFNHQATILVILAQQKHGRPITYKLRKSEYFIHPGSIRTGKILLAVIKMCGLGNKVGLVKGVWESIQDFVPMDSKLESERFKRPGTLLEKERAKRLKTVISVEEVYPETLAVKRPILGWYVQTEGQLKRWKIIRVGEFTKLYQSFKDLVKAVDREDLDTLWKMAQELQESRKLKDPKEMKLWIELKRLYEPDNQDSLWKQLKKMHEPLQWKLYELSGVHHVSTDKGYEIFMLREKDYHLSVGIALLMISNKLQLKCYSDHANELIEKIYKIANQRQ